MTRYVVFRPQAEDEALEVRRWYDVRRAGLGSEFGVVVDTVIERIAANPFAFPRAHKDTRRAVLRRFPYAIYFRAADQAVIVLAVHGRQHPARWRGRK
jgi:plasmid stabilization system protein ParE